ncbi:MAG TPA: WYL domain-containing protein [Acidimicrobiales bacterium]|nr:WYL domain-containing protein [Acidimicrobiales bacterium]
MTKPADTAGRFRRLLAILAWLAQVEEAPIDEAASRFEMTPEELVDELEMAACCGVPPYTPDQLMEIVVTDTSVSARLGRSLARPRRLSPHEGFALAAAARALVATPGSDENGALSRALAKLERALGGEPVGVELDNPPFLSEVRAAMESGSELAIAYYSASSDRLTDRKIRPVRLFAAEGHWYLDAWCGEAGDMRRFRVDRISEVRPLEAGTLPPVPVDAAGTSGSEGLNGGGPQPGDPGFAVFVPGPDHRRVRLFVEEPASWLLESIPSVGPPEPVPGGVEVEVFVGGTAWLERLLLRLSPHARVVDPAEDRTVVRDAARRILRRYGAEVAGPGP